MPLVRLMASLFLLITADTLFAYNATVDVSATVSIIKNCKFNTSDSLLSLGVLDPEVQVDRTLKTSIIFKCSGSDAPAVYFNVSDSGQFDSGVSIDRKMKHSSIQESYIPYKLSLEKVSGVEELNIDQSLNLLISVKGTDYRQVYSGVYSDVIYISVTP